MRTYIKPGTVVRVKTGTYSKLGRGVMAQNGPGGACRVMLDCGELLCCPWELAVCRDQSPPPEPMRLRLSYGLWRCADGREVLFNRDYQPIWQRRPGEPATPGDREERPPLSDCPQFFYDGCCVPWWNVKSRDICEAALAAFQAGHPVSPWIVGGELGHP